MLSLKVYSNKIFYIKDTLLNNVSFCLNNCAIIKIIILIAEKYNCCFLSNKELETGVDGIHLTKENHNKLANILNTEIKNV